MEPILAKINSRTTAVCACRSIPSGNFRLISRHFHKKKRTIEEENVDDKVQVGPSSMQLGSWWASARIGTSAARIRTSGSISPLRWRCGGRHRRPYFKRATRKKWKCNKVHPLEIRARPSCWPRAGQWDRQQLALCILYFSSIAAGRDVAQVAERAKLHADVLHWRNETSSWSTSRRTVGFKKKSCSSTNNRIDFYLVSNDSQFCPLNVVKV